MENEGILLFVVQGEVKKFQSIVNAKKCYFGCYVTPKGTAAELLKRKSENENILHVAELVLTPRKYTRRNISPG